MNKKILVFVYDGRKFLALRNNSKDSSHGGDFWFTVTGSINKGEDIKEAIKREIKEEINLNVKELFDLKWGSVYSWGDKYYLEKNFIAFVNNGIVKLNEEHTECEWLNLDDFIKKIKWDLDKKELKKVLELGVKKQLFFKKEKIEKLK